LMLRRNSIEGIFSQCKRRGIGTRDHYKARWATKGWRPVVRVKVPGVASARGGC
jgi:hypothetical protein